MQVAVANRARGWDRAAQLDRVPSGPPKPGALFVRLPGTNGTPSLVWCGPFSEPAGLRTSESAAFYFQYARMDGIACIEWQLAEANDDASTNPFIPLLRCYRAGAYPFSLGRDAVVLFRFEAALL